MEDNEIIELYWKRDEVAIQETDRKYGKYCSKIAHNILASVEDSEECVNDTYLHAWNVLPPNRPSVFKAFLAKITRNLALDKYDSKTAQKRNNSMDLVYEELEDCIPANSIDKEIEYNELVKEINMFLGDLPKEKRVVFLERYWYMSSIKDIATKHKQKESKTKMELSRMRNALRKYLEERGEVV